mgnify:CR=1 FL=1
MLRDCPSDQGVLSVYESDYSGGISAIFSVQDCVKLHQVAVMVTQSSDPARAPWTIAVGESFNRRGDGPAHGLQPSRIPGRCAQYGCSGFIQRLD